ncbi:MAG: hypothetical protein WA828_02055 [Coleofasciculaceae cyanobacterium]
MLIWHCRLLLNKLTKNRFYFIKGIVCISLLLVLNTGCSQTSETLQRLPSLLPNLSSNADFNIQVTPSGRSGIYTVTGKTNLPDKSSITVAAIRLLKPDKSRILNLTPDQTYSILAYQDVKVNKGAWQTTLNLWKVAPSGQFQETWQLEQSKLGLSMTSEPDVTFLATVAPTGSLSELESQLEKQGVKLVSNLVRNTVDGERYIQASQVLAVDLPKGQTTPPQPKPEDINGGWGNRFLLIPEPPNINNYEQPDKRRTTAPISPSEFLQ